MEESGASGIPTRLEKKTEKNQSGERSWKQLEQSKRLRSV
jgi:hypothetical protein